MLPVSAIASSGSIDYDKSELVDSNTTSSNQESSKDKKDNSWWIPNWFENATDKTKKTLVNTWNGTKEIAISGFDLIRDKTNQGIEWISDKLHGVGEWWSERSLLEKSLIILGTGAAILTGGVALGFISAGAAVVAGIGGAINYGLYAMNTDDASLVGGLGMMTLGALGGIGFGALRGIGVLGARGGSLLTAASKGISHSRVGGVIKNGMSALGRTRVGTAILSSTGAVVRAARPVLGLISSKGALTGGAISSVFAGGTHVYNTVVNGEPLDSKAMINDMVVWGAAGAVGAGLATKTFQGIGTLTKSKGLKTASSSTVGGTSEYVLGNLFEGKSPGIKKTLMVAGLSLTLGGAVAFGPSLGNIAKQDEIISSAMNNQPLVNNKSAPQSNSIERTGTLSGSNSYVGGNVRKNGSDLTGIPKVDLQFFSNNNISGVNEKVEERFFGNTIGFKNTSKLVGEEVKLPWLNDEKYKAVQVEGTVNVNGKKVDISRRVYQKNSIDWEYKPVNPSGKGLTNKELAAKGRPPFIIDKNGKEAQIELHHLIQKETGNMVEIEATSHDEYTKVLHGLVENGNSFRNNPELIKQYTNFMRKYWRWRHQSIERR